MSDVPVPTDHAKEFAHQYAKELDEYCALRMEELGVPSERIGASDHIHRITWCAFNPYETQGGSVSPDGRINVDSGITDDTLFPAGMALKDRIDSVIAHEFEEHRTGSHDEAIEAAPDTGLPISHAARELLRLQREQQRGR